MTLDETMRIAEAAIADHRLQTPTNFGRMREYQLAEWVAAVAPHLEHLLRVSQAPGGDIEERLSALDAAIEALRAAVEGDHG